jgi:F-type H+-transporting ATPase subunit delta
MTASAQGSARRYARAVLELALERGHAEALRTELRAARQTLESHPDLRAPLLSPAVAAERKRDLVRRVWSASDGAAGLVARLLALLAERHRLALLPTIEQQFGQLWNAHRQVLTADVSSAVALTGEQLDALRGAIKARTGRDVEFQTHVEPRLLGGLSLQMGGRIYDGTVRAQLATLRARLTAGGAV